MTKRLLLSGVGGSIGAHVLAHLLHNTDWHIVGLDSFRHKGLTDRVIEVTHAHPDWIGRYTIHTHDLRAPISPQLASLIGPVDYIISMASLSDVEASLADPAQFIASNVAIATNMLEFARIYQPASLRAFIQISTDEVYGPCSPYWEGSVLRGHREWEPHIPSNPYAASKSAQESIAISYWRAYGVPLILTNTMNNFSEMQQPAKYPASLQRKILAGETVTVHGRPGEIGSRFYLHSRNHADALLFLLNHITPHAHVDGTIDRPDRYNIVGDRRVDNLELAQLIARILDKPLHYTLEDAHAARPGHDRHYGLDGSKLSALGWRPPLTFEKSLENTVRWTLQHPEWL